MFDYKDINHPSKKWGNTEFSFSADLRSVFRVQDNHQVREILANRKVFVSSNDMYTDCESACFYIYFKNLRLAKKFINALNQQPEVQNFDPNENFYDTEVFIVFGIDGKGISWPVRVFTSHKVADTYATACETEQKRISSMSSGTVSRYDPQCKQWNANDISYYIDTVSIYTGFYGYKEPKE